ncbi:MAG: MarR family transcriptional regulator, partial [Clostridia bacterium]|nr:MarR family transcriptional regulator [Clostridia bacterium]
MRQTIKQRERMKKIFLIIKKMEDAMQPGKNTPFNGTELRLLKELMLARMENERLISTQIATKLGVTRSSVSQMVNKLEKQGVVYRQADEVDRKIAYIMMTEEAEKVCE